MTAEIIPFTPPQAPRMKCSFCKRTKDEVQKLVASNVSNHAIYGDCVVHAAQRIKDSDA